ncbi:deoxynucleotidyltransferase terminal-interacting protein 2 isoform X2 [Anthonomus grandis grandis]|uniref:deoxynucleotidyltransferase terminal-interacting protein 2 isoform X2 n=1 Tax=Anthonomus grandis grandis TaxID=2921223 RepID=UPI0021651A1C|nr:deoxynucleotidyltransferase terminal-interacting protein 2 isoform X2 [Anthonomus grandis grandis]
MDFSFVLDSVGDKARNEVFSSFPIEETEASTHTKGLLIEQLKQFRDKRSGLLKQKKQDVIPKTGQTELKTSMRAFKKTEWFKKQKAKAEGRKPEILKIKSIIGTNNIKDSNKAKNLDLEVKKAVQKAVVGEHFEDLTVVPPYDVPKKRLQQERKNKREKTKGKNWFNLPATEMTEEIKQDLEVLQMRSVLNPKQFYKKNDTQVLPKYFQVGEVLDSPLDYYNNRMTKKERKKTLVNELLADADFQKYNKRKYQEIMEEKQKKHYKSWRNAKKLKKK